MPVWWQAGAMVCETRRGMKQRAGKVEQIQQTSSKRQCVQRVVAEEQTKGVPLNQKCRQVKRIAQREQTRPTQDVEQVAYQNAREKKPGETGINKQRETAKGTRNENAR